MLDPPPGDPKNRSFWTVLPLEIAILGVKNPIFRACGAPKIADLPLEIAILGPQNPKFFRPPKAAGPDFGGFQKIWSRNQGGLLARGGYWG